MRDTLDRVAQVLRPLGYKREKGRFFRSESGFYRLIDFQLGVHGGGYFFVNLCIHPIGLPELQLGRLVIAEKPKEHECILRQRIEQAVPTVEKGIFETDGPVDALVSVMRLEVQQWFDHWCDWGRLATAPADVMYPMLTVVPTLRVKALLMVQFFCHLRLGDAVAAERAYRDFAGVRLPGFDFGHVERHLESLLERQGGSSANGNSKGNGL